MRKIALLIAGVLLATGAFSQVVNDKYTLEKLTDDSVTVSSANDHRNQIKWFSSDKAIVYNGEYYFTAQTAGLGKELWKTDGTKAGTVLVKDINPGTASSNPDAFMIAGPAGSQMLYFTADDGVHGMEVWKTDGSEGGTELVYDLYVDADGDAEDIITPADTMCLDCIISAVDTTFVMDTVFVANGATGPTYEHLRDTIFDASMADSAYISSNLDIEAIDTTCGNLRIVEWDRGLEVHRIGDSTWTIPGNKQFQTGYCYVRAADTVKQTGNGGSIPFALSKFGDDLLFTGIYEDEFGYSSQGLRWLYRYDISEDKIELVTDEIQPYPFYRQNDAMRWNIQQPFQIIDIKGTPIALFMGKHKKYGDEICYTDGIPKSKGGKTGVVLDFNDLPDPNSSIEGATKNSATLDWIQKVHPNWVIFRNSTLGKWGGNSNQSELDQNPWATNGYQTWLIDDMNQQLAGDGTRTSPSYLGDYFMFKGALYCGGQGGPIDKQITKFSSVAPQSQETWFISGPNDAGVYGNSRLGKAGYFKDPHTNKEYMFFGARVDRGRTLPPADPEKASKFDYPVEYALFFTEGTYDDLAIADSLSHTKVGNGDMSEQITQYRDKLYLNDWTGSGERELFGFALAGNSGYAENTYFNVVDFASAGNPSNLRAVGDYMVMKNEANKQLYALEEKNPTYTGATPVYDPEEQLMETLGSVPAWDGTWDYGFGSVVNLADGQNEELKALTGINEVFDITAIGLYPNPATEKITLTIDEKYAPVSYSIVNMSGQVVQSGKYTGNEINVNTLTSGQYSIGVLTEDKRILVKIFLKH